MMDMTTTLARLGGDRALLHTLVEFFTEDCPQLLARLDDALVAQDARRFERAAHSLKGLAVNFDAPEVVRLATELEALGRKGVWTGAQELLDAIQVATQRLLAELAPYRAGN